MSFRETFENLSLKELHILIKPNPLVISENCDIHTIKKNRIIEIINAIDELESRYNNMNRHVPLYYREIAKKTIKRLTN
jgi:hypothetical protein